MSRSSLSRSRVRTGKQTFPSDDQVRKTYKESAMKQSEILREKGYITASEAAQRFGRHVSSIYRLVESKAVDGLRIGRSCTSSSTRWWPTRTPRILTWQRC